MNLLAPQDWTFPVPIAYGPGRLKEITHFCRQEGLKNPLIITDRGSVGLPFIQDLLRYLAEGGLDSRLYSGISPNPLDTEVASGCSYFREGGHDGIIAIGGGSGMDGAKAVALVATSGMDLWDFDYEKPPADVSGRPAFPPLICIPTTAGTGAETESTAMITETSRTMKLCVWHPKLKPAVAILDPAITCGLPAELTAWTGADALVHAIEAYCVPVFHPLCDGAALEALRLIAAWLPVAVSEPDNIEARGAMLVGSCLAGISFNKGLGLVHAISHMAGAEYNTHHGLTNAIILPSVLKFNEPSIEAKIAPMSQAMGLSGTDFAGFYSAVCNLLGELGIPPRLTDIGVPIECVPRVAAKAILDVASETNPRKPAIADIEAILSTALAAGR